MTDVRALAQGASIEVLPGTAAQVPDFRKILPQGTRIFIAHLDTGTPQDILDTTRRILDEGFVAVPHVVARMMPDAASLGWLVGQYRDLGVTEAMVLAGDAETPAGPFDSAMSLLQTGLFNGFGRLYVVGHPEGSRKLDPDGGTTAAEAALRDKQDWAKGKGIAMEIVTQFAFDADLILNWRDTLRDRGIDLPVRLGLAGPSPCDLLLEQAEACGVGPSLRHLRDMPDRNYDPTPLVAEIAAQGGNRFTELHLFPFGGIEDSARWITDRS